MPAIRSDRGRLQSIYGREGDGYNTRKGKKSAVQARFRTSRPPYFRGGQSESKRSLTMTINTQIATVVFHGHALTVITGPAGEHLVAMKPIVEAIGLQWEAQLKRIKRHSVLAACMSMMDIQMSGDDQRRELACLPLDMLNGWLFGVDASRVRPEIRDTLIQYQRECFAALSAYWQKGEAVNPRSTISPRPLKALPNGLSHDQQDAIKGLVKARVEALPQSKQAKAAITCWSALKSKFGCTYKEIEPAQFAEALSLVARLPLEGELLEAERPKPLELHYPASWLPEHNPHLRGYSYERSADPSLHLNTSSLCGMDSRSPTLALTAELTRAGHDVEACRMEVLAMRHQLERYLDLCRNLGNLADRHEHGGIVFKLSGAVHMTR